MCVSLLPQKKKHLRATAGRIHFDPIFPKTREYPCAYVSCHSPIKYISAYFISSWSDNCNICSFFRKKFDENRKTLPFSSLVSTGVKGEIRLVFKPFDFVFTNWDRLPNYMRPGLEPIKGAHVCWGLPWISTLKLENTMSNILLYSYIHMNTLVNIPHAQWKNNMLFKVLRVQHEDIFQKQSAES